MRTLPANLQEDMASYAFTLCRPCDPAPPRFKKAVKQMGWLFLTACLAAYYSHVLQGDLSSPAGESRQFRAEEDDIRDDLGIRIGGVNDTEDRVKYEEALAGTQFEGGVPAGLQHPPKSRQPKEAISDDMRKVVQHIVQYQLQIYDSDKTGLTDFALENLGGCIVSVRSTLTYNMGGDVTFLGYPVFSFLANVHHMLGCSTEPRAIIQPKMQPGDCWTIAGDRGTVVIRLFAQVFITGLTLEHISKLISPTGEITSAPKRVSLFGLRCLDDESPHKFGSFEYRKDGPGVQTFAAPDLADTTYHMVEVKVESNHGNREYTCIYRVRIHGSQEPDHNS